MSAAAPGSAARGLPRFESLPQKLLSMWRSLMPPIVVSLINLKGGVGKTTTTVQLAECLVSEFGKRVLVIDLDPQTNATISLIDETKWEALNNAGQTIAQLFLDKLENTTKFNLTSAVQAGV